MTSLSMLNRHSLAFAPMYDTPGRRDASKAFIPEARRFLEHWCLPEENLILIDNHASPLEMRQQVTLAVHTRLIPTVPAHERLCFAFFCHGSRRSIQFGFRGAEGVAGLAGLLSPFDNRVVVPLYCCLTGGGDESHGGDGGFADLLRDNLCLHGADQCRVDGHTERGHCCVNPYVRRFDGDGSRIGGTGGYFIVARRTKLWNRWRAALRDDMRFDFPALEVAEIIKYIQS